MSINFSVRPEDPLFMHLAAELIENHAPVFNEWLVATGKNMSATPQDLMQAVCIVFATELSALGGILTKPGNERDFASTSSKIIYDVMVGLAPGAPRARDN